ncbi:MAG: hypothetical protein COA91_12495 [Robiginitomaculum sp.]|nr:MAG: hypothetical protein COA91_12495 [Robiginitomaculum sp.]
MRILLFIGLFVALLLGVFLGIYSTKKPVPIPVIEAIGPWHLLPAQSHLGFISVKKGTMVETHHFGELSGMVSVDGVANITANLDSVQTNIDIRDERMRTYLFQTDKFPLAKISTKIDMTLFTALTIGERKNISQNITVNMHANTADYVVGFIVTRLGVNKISVASQNPVVLDIEDFALQDGLDKLRDLASLSSITPQVPVSFSLVFER